MRQDKYDDAVSQQRQVECVGGRCINLPYKVLKRSCDSNFVRCAGFMFLSTVNQHNEPSCGDRT